MSKQESIGSSNLIDKIQQVFIALQEAGLEDIKISEIIIRDMREMLLIREFRRMQMDKAIKKASDAFASKCSK
jgi:archaellum biogenesis protein FlaJ (TadC family)